MCTDWVEVAETRRKVAKGLGFVSAGLIALIAIILSVNFGVWIVYAMLIAAAAAALGFAAGYGGTHLVNRIIDSRY